MGGAFNVTELDFEISFVGVDIEREGNLKKFVGFAPVYFSIESYASKLPDRNSLPNCGLAKGSKYFNGASYRTFFHDFNRIALE